MNKWVKESIFYEIFPLGFCGALSRNKIYEDKNSIKKLEKWIPHLKSMGINAIYLGPVFESTNHGYDTKDYYNIDKRLGSNEVFKEVCKELHKNNIKIILDGVFNHVGREFWAFKDVQNNRENSKFCDWFVNINFNNNSPMGDNFSYEGWNGCYDLVKLNLKNRKVLDYLLHAIEIWIDEFDIDGLRLDAADSIDFEFFKILKKFTENKKDDFWLMGEVIHGDYTRWANKESLDSTTNYECYKGIFSSHNDKNYFEIAYSLNRLFGDGGIYKDLCLYNFVDNHDVNRIASNLKKPQYIYNVYTLLFTMPGIPSIYYGSEWALEGIKGKNTDEPLRPELDLDNIKNPNLKLLDFIKNLSNIRINLDTLKYGNYKQVLVKNEQFIFVREYKEEKVFVILNLSDKDSFLDFEIPFEKGIDLLNNNKIIDGGKISLKVEAFSSKIIIKQR